MEAKVCEKPGIEPPTHDRTMVKCLNCEQNVKNYANLKDPNKEDEHFYLIESESNSRLSSFASSISNLFSLNAQKIVPKSSRKHANDDKMSSPNGTNKELMTSNNSKIDLVLDNYCSINKFIRCKRKSSQNLIENSSSKNRAKLTSSGKSLRIRTLPKWMTYLGLLLTVLICTSAMAGEN